MFKKFLTIFILLILLFSSILVFPVSSEQNEATDTDEYGWYVDDIAGEGPDNPSEDFTCIQDAIDNASEGDSIFVYNGEYNEKLTIEKSINLIGEDKENTMIYKGGNGHLIKIKKDDVTISGFFIKSSVSYSDAIINVESDFNTIEDNILDKSYYGIKLGTNKYTNKYGGQHILIHVNFNTISNNIIKNCCYGIIPRKSSNETFFNNTFIDCTSGISIGSSSNNTLVSHNNFFNSGIKIGSFDDTFILINNLINLKPLVYLKDESNINIDDAGQIYLINCDNITVQNQDLSYTKNGIYIQDSENILINNNDICKNYEPGVIIKNSNDITVSNNNILSNNKKDIHYDAGGVLVERSNYNVIDNNIFSNNSRSGIYLFLSNNNLISENIISCQKENRGETLDSFRAKNNIISKNVFNNKSFNINYHSDNNIVHNNTFNDCRVSIDGSSNTRFEYNKLYPSDQKWVKLFDDPYSNLIYNLGRRNVVGVDGRNNVILYNDFMSTKSGVNVGSQRVTFSNNYWGRPRILPKLLLGFGDPGYTIYYSFDREPALKPNCDFGGDS